MFETSSFGKGKKRYNNRALSETTHDSAILSAHIKAALEEYKLEELIKKKNKLETKLEAVDEELAKLEKGKKRCATPPTLRAKSASLPRLPQNTVIQPSQSLIAELNNALSNSSVFASSRDNLSMSKESLSIGSTTSSFPHSQTPSSLRPMEANSLPHAVSMSSMSSITTGFAVPELETMEDEDAEEAAESFQHVLCDLVEDDAPKMKEKRIIQFEIMVQDEDETLEGFLSRLQHGVISAYGSENLEVLYRRVAWAFIRGMKDSVIRKFVVKEGWTKSESETLSPAELLELAYKVLYYQGAILISNS